MIKFQKSECLKIQGMFELAAPQDRGYTTMVNKSQHDLVSTFII
jgi:hypothetical protein